MVQIEAMVVDRLENDEEAVVLVGPEERAFVLARSLLRIAGLDFEKARGILVATHSGESVVIEVWPAVEGSDATVWQPDSNLLRHRAEVGA
jgi:hypothetical protein